MPLAIFVIQDLLHPGHCVAVERLCHCEMRHRFGLAGPGQVTQMRRDSDDIAETDLFDWPVLLLNPVAGGMDMPGRAGTRGRTTNKRWCIRLVERGDVDLEP